MESYELYCGRLFSTARIPMVVTDGKTTKEWPKMPEQFLKEGMMELVLNDFRVQNRDCLHPLISYIDPGFFIGVAELEPGVYAVIGLVSPFQHSRTEILSFCSAAITPSCLQQYCDIIQSQRPITLPQLKDYLCLLVQLSQNAVISPDNILLNDFSFQEPVSVSALDQNLFDMREEMQSHVPVDFEKAICDAIEAGDLRLLHRSLSASPSSGRVGRMSASVLQQYKYELVSLATLISRAAIRGGLSAETAFNLSDIYCQRADLLNEPESVQRLTVQMMTDFCRKVDELHQNPLVSSLILKCTEYISVHLHETITLDDLSDHCGLCGRSLSLRFRKETGMGINEYIHKEKIKEAKYLLQHSDYTLTEITLFLNYPSQSYFTQIFRRYTGWTPLQFRESPAATA